MNNRQRFLAACRREATDRTPIWIMRQAGRYLPEYRALKEKHSFVTMVRTPELALEVTLQPIRRFDFDAAVLFSDILVIPEALGQPYHFRDAGGIGMDYAIESRAQIEALSVAGIAERLGYVAQAITLVRDELAGRTALLGFGGSPWTLATYMVEGGSSTNFSRIKALFYSDRPLFELLMEKITAALAEYFRMQIRAGVDAIQIFDSWGGICASNIHETASLKWIRSLIDGIGGEAPVILFARGAHHAFSALASTGADVLSLDWTADLAGLRRQYPLPVALQGNLDPVLLNTTPDIVRREAGALLASMAGQPGHIFNLGHGILPQARIENVETLVETVRETRG